MADTGIFCSGTEVTRKAGNNADTTATAEAYLNDFIAQAESEINVLCRTNFSDSYSSLNADVKGLLKQAASNLAAIYVLNYNPTGDDGTLSRIEYEDRINILRDALLRNLSILRDQKAVTFINGA